MDPNAARATLQIPVDQPLTVEVIDAAYQRELWQRHPSRYPDAEGRRAAEAWRETLGRARGALVAELAAPPTHADEGASPGRPRRRLGAAAVAGIVAGGVLVLALVVAGGIGLYSAVRGVTETAIAEAEAAAVERYQAGETLYAFPAALEIYADDRYFDDCAIGYMQGCWQMALFTESDCSALEVTLSFYGDGDSWTPAETRTMLISEVVANRATPVVFGNDDYSWGDVSEVVCLDDPVA
ncbi:hypothetical protein [Agromyces sp. SYSU T0242]|uniref:hypothetical protein n=1 Tax=Agromyces litoreus TaxID=3158561 RepID=UPI00339307DB